MHFYQAVQENNLAEITVAYESGWNRLTEKFYAKTEWPEAELIAPLVNDGSYFHRSSLDSQVLTLLRSHFPNLVSRIILPARLLQATTKPR